MARMRGTLGTELPDVSGLRIGPPPGNSVAPHRLDCMAFHGNGNALRAYGYRRPPAAAAKPELSRRRDRPWPAVASRIARLTSRFRDRWGIRSALWPLLRADRPTPQVESAATSRASPPSRRPDFFCFNTPSCGRRARATGKQPQMGCVRHPIAADIERNEAPPSLAVARRAGGIFTNARAGRNEHAQATVDPLVENNRKERDS
jgi:hypothetical protein